MCDGWMVVLHCGHCGSTSSPLLRRHSRGAGCVEDSTGSESSQRLFIYKYNGEQKTLTWCQVISIILMLVSIIISDRATLAAVRPPFSCLELDSAGGAAPRQGLQLTNERPNRPCHRPCHYPSRLCHRRYVEDRAAGRGANDLVILTVYGARPEPPIGGRLR